MRRCSASICVIMVLLFIAHGLVVADSPGTEPIQLSEDQRKEFSIFFSTFTQAFLQPFEKGQISDAEMIRFALCRLRIERGYRNLKRWDNDNWAAPAHDVDDLANKYFGKSVNTHQSIREL